MTILADESVDFPVVSRLRLEGHAVAAIAELVDRRKLPHAGVLLIRLLDYEEHELCDAVAFVVREHGSALAGAFSVFKDGVLRIRKDPLE
jgi:hypothetical protein